MKFWDSIAKWLGEFKGDVSASGYEWKNWVKDKDTSIKSHNPTTYDRFDKSFGLHKDYMEDAKKREAKKLAKAE